MPTKIAPGVAAKTADELLAEIHASGSLEELMNIVAPRMEDLAGPTTGPYGAINPGPPSNFDPAKFDMAPAGSGVKTVNPSAVNAAVDAGTLAAAAKTTGKGLSRFIPVLGWALLALSAVQMAGGRREEGKNRRLNQMQHGFDISAINEITRQTQMEDMLNNAAQAAYRGGQQRDISSTYQSRIAEAELAELVAGDTGRLSMVQRRASRPSLAQLYAQHGLM